MSSASAPDAIFKGIELASSGALSGLTAEGAAENSDEKMWRWSIAECSFAGVRAAVAPRTGRITSKTVLWRQGQGIVENVLDGRKSLERMSSTKEREGGEPRESGNGSGRASVVRSKIKRARRWASCMWMGGVKSEASDVEEARGVGRRGAGVTET